MKTPQEQNDLDCSGDYSTAGILVDINEEIYNDDESVNKYSKYSWTSDGIDRILSGNGIRNHEVGTFPNADNPNTITEQNVNKRFTLCPENVSKEPIINYLDNLKIGEVFNKAVRYENSESTIEDFCITIDKKKLWVITKIQGWRYGLLEVEYSGGQFNHIAHGTFMTIIGARKELTIKNGNEWLGEDSIDDYM